MGGTNKQRQLIPVLANEDGSLTTITNDSSVAMAAADAAQKGGLCAAFKRSAPKHAHLGRISIRISEVAS